MYLKTNLFVTAGARPQSDRPTLYLIHPCQRPNILTFSRASLKSSQPCPPRYLVACTGGGLRGGGGEKTGNRRAVTTGVPLSPHHPRLFSRFFLPSPSLSKLICRRMLLVLLYLVRTGVKTKTTTADRHLKLWNCSSVGITLRLF